MARPGAAVCARAREEVAEWAAAAAAGRMMAAGHMPALAICIQGEGS